MRCLSRTLLDDGREAWEGHGHRADRAPRLDEIDRRPMPSELSLEREIDAFLWALDLAEAVADFEAEGDADELLELDREQRERLERDAAARDLGDWSER